MIEAIGNISLSAAVLAAALTVLACVAAARFNSNAWRSAANWLMGLIAVLFTVASGALLTAFINSDFRFEYVASYSEKALPLGYKIAAFWAGQEGSLLLWAWLLAVLCLIAVFGFRKWRVSFPSS